MDSPEQGAGERRLPLAPRGPDEPALSRLPADHPGRSKILSAHSESLLRGEVGYLDPISGLYVLNARFLTDRGTCCARGCRHCPYVVD